MYCPNCSVAFTPSQVAYIGEDVEAIPHEIITKHAKVAKILDLSYNRLK